MTTKTERQAASARMFKCECGNIVGVGLAKCGACLSAAIVEGDKARKVENVMEAVEAFVQVKLDYDRAYHATTLRLDHSNDVDKAREQLRLALAEVLV